MSNVYNLTFQKPAVEKHEMFTALEELATQLVHSGRLRIDAYERINFVRLPTDEQVLFFSHRELHDKKLIQRTMAQIGKENFKTLKKEIKTNTLVPSTLELKIARLLVQSTHPAVMKLLLLEGVEIFVSYSHNIADLLDLQTYQIHGGNSGMQSLGFAESRIFVSCDGDPFTSIKDEQEHAKYSLSRFMVIAAQELGHYADIKRDKNGYPFTRHSADFGTFKAKPKVRVGRKKDLEWTKTNATILELIGLKEAAKLEKSINFFSQHRRNSFKYFWTVLKARRSTKKLHELAEKDNISVAKLHSARHLAIMLSDMKFNLHPKAPVYEREDPQQEEAIVCVEALARVPQQVVKWGHRTTKFFYPHLYKIYYEEVIPHVIKSYEKLSGEEFKMEYKKPKASILKRLSFQKA